MSKPSSRADVAIPSVRTRARCPVYPLGTLLDSIWKPSLLQLRECWARRRQGIQWKALLVLCEAEPSGGTSSQGCKLCPPKKQVPSRAVGTPTLDIALDVEETGSPRNIEICRSPGARCRAWRRSEDQGVEGRAASYQGGESGS